MVSFPEFFLPALTTFKVSMSWNDSS